MTAKQPVKIGNVKATTVNVAVHCSFNLSAAVIHFGYRTETISLFIVACLDTLNLSTMP